MDKMIYKATPPTLGDLAHSAPLCDADGNLKVVAGAAGTLPTGAATSAKQDTQITAEQAILAKIIAAPATEAKQDTGNTSLASILAKIIAAPATEATLAAQSAKLPATLGPKTPALSLSATPAVLTPYAKAAGLTTSPFGATGAAGDYLSHVILQPAAVGAGTTTIFNNATAVYVYTAGTLADLRPIVVPINALSVGGSWNITTGANMAATGFGTFT
jgi:hypothetical protein